MKISPSISHNELGSVAASKNVLHYIFITGASNSLKTLTFFWPGIRYVSHMCNEDINNVTTGINCHLLRKCALSSVLTDGPSCEHVGR